MALLRFFLLFGLFASDLLLLLSPVVGVCVPRNASVTFEVAPSPVASALKFQSAPAPLKQQISPAPQPQAPLPAQAATISSVGGVDDGLLPLPSLLNAAVAAFCKKTDYPEECQSSAQQFLPVVADAQTDALVDAVAFLKVQMAACRAKVEAAQSEVAALLKKPGTTPMVASTLQVCDDSYSDAFDNLDATDKAVEARDKGTINSMLSALVDDFSTCEDGFIEMQVASPLAAIDGALSKLASNCLAIADLI